MAQEVVFIKLLNSQTLSLYSMLLEIEKTEKETSDHFGYQEYQPRRKIWVFHIQNL